MAPSNRAPEITGAEIQALADAVNDYVDNNFSASEHLPAELQKLLRPLEVATGQGALPVLAMTAAAMAGLSNGANIQLWTFGSKLRRSSTCIDAPPRGLPPSPVEGGGAYITAESRRFHAPPPSKEWGATRRRASLCGFL
eukprot:9484606-Pyramimonas_sp.AAC.1